MILVKNKLKKIKNTIDDEDMLNYLKYSHLEPIREDDVLKINTSNKATQAPDIMNNFSQTDKKKDMVDKETDTYDELNKIEPTYFSTMTSAKFKSKEPSRAEKMAQIWTTTVEQHTPPSSHNESDDDDDEGLMSRNLNRGLRVAQLTGSAMLTALNIADTIAQTTLNPVIGGAIDYFLTNPSTEQNEEIPSGSVDVPQYEPRDRSRSRDNSEDDNIGHRLLQRGASRSRSITPSSGTASSAKTTPKGKKSDF